VVETDVASPRLALDQPPAAIDEPVTITSYSAHEVTAQVHIAQDGLLVLSEVFYPGWRAEVDGEARPILATDMTLRGVYLDAGDHTVVFTYRPPVFFIGLGFSLFTVAAAVITWIVLSKRRQTQSVDGKDGSNAYDT
jgi:uncharacterized membrane protein YfhO